MRRVGGLRPNDPARLGPYRLVGRLGVGGQGVVYLARDPADRLVAVKALHTELADDHKATERFVKELAATRKIAPFCTAQVLDADISSNQPYIVSEYIDGPSLQQAVTEQGPRTGNELHRLAIATATALAAIHEAGVVHRDFKPHNVLLGPDGPRVIDFGIARALDGATMTSSRPIGTPAFMAPEQIAGQPIGPPADVFAWGGVMVFAATGKPAFHGDSIPAVMERITRRKPDLDGLTGSLRTLVQRCLAKNPAKRPTAHEIHNRLLRASDAHAWSTPVPGYGAVPGDFRSGPAPPRHDAGAPTVVGPPANAGPHLAGQHHQPGGMTLQRSYRPMPWTYWGQRTRRIVLAAVTAVVATAALLTIPAWTRDATPVRANKNTPAPVRDDVSLTKAPIPTDNSVGSVALEQLGGKPVAVSASWDKEILGVWDLTTGRQINELAGHTDVVNAVAAGRLAGKPIAVSGGEDQTVRVWDLTTGTQLYELSGHDDAVNSVALGQLDGTTVAVSSGEDQTIRIWDLTTGEGINALDESATLTVATGQLDGTTVAVSDSGDDDDDTYLQVSDLLSGEGLYELTGHTDTVNTIALGQLAGTPVAVSGSDDQTVRVWDLDSGDQIHELAGHTDAVGSVAVGQLGGKTIAVSGGDDQAIRVWDLTNGQQIRELTGHTDAVNSVAVGQFAGKTIAVSGSTDGSIRAWTLGPA